MIAYLKFSLKIEKEFLLKQLFMKIQLSTFMISVNFKILQFLNKGVVRELKAAKFIILSAFLEIRYVIPQAIHI